MPVVRDSDADPLLIYDGDCAFCSSAVRFIERRIRHRPRCEPWQRLDLEALGISQQECERALQYIDGDGRLFAGEIAVARVLVDAGKGWALIGATMRVPGIRHASGFVYRWVARNRHRMPGGTPQCSLPQEQRVSVNRSIEEERASSDRLSARASAGDET